MPARCSRPTALSPTRVRATACSNISTASRPSSRVTAPSRRDDSLLDDEVEIPAFRGRVGRQIRQRFLEHAEPILDAKLRRKTDDLAVERTPRLARALAHLQALHRADAGAWHACRRDVDEFLDGVRARHRLRTEAQRARVRAVARLEHKLVAI